MNFLVHSQKELLFEGRVDYDLNWNDHAVFDSKVIVVMLVHHNGSEINRAINSILNQESETTFALLIIDDYGGYLKSHGPVLNDNRIAIAEIKACSVSQARNIAHYIVKSRFHGADWICRLDADDEIADPYAIQAITAELEGLDSSVNWALAGNTLELDGQKINRVNLAEPDLLTQKGVLKPDRFNLGAG